ncbi:hypothetical protein ACIOEZ_07575 [Streptomyces sp. NPDC087866]|uniref:hypothetical protein n=1 Tax=unclassified Streptomyces TaxID=2593676 RepID=UPI0022576C6F|nr:hypothetical protein [Streptomyces sp. NBC_01789]MCX4444950.1 hypothetical protein [Streptomyces sp. NBC_01789]
MPDISRRALLGATGAAATSTILVTTGTAQAADTSGGKDVHTPPSTSKEAGTLMTSGSQTLKYVAYISSPDMEVLNDATFGVGADPADMWAYLDDAMARLQERHPSYSFTPRLVRYDQVTTEMPRP